MKQPPHFDAFVCQLSLTMLTLICLSTFSWGQNNIFREIASTVGLNFQHFNGAAGNFHLPEIMGSGVAVFDFDNDGDLDIYLLQGTALDTAKPRFPLATNAPKGNRLFRNELQPSGKLQFTDVTEKSGLGVVVYGMGIATGDYDNDGFIDLYVTNFGANFLFHNNQNGTFTDVTQQANVDDPRWSTSASFVDYDQDGKLDLFVCNYVDFTVTANKPCAAPTGERDYCGPQQYRGLPAKLFHNDGGGKFSDVTNKSGISASYGPGLGVSCADFNQDGLIDIYVANDGAANLLWINQGNGKFTEEGLMAGAAYSMDGVPRAGMGVAVGDFDNDNDDDVLVTNLIKEGSTLYQNLTAQGQKGLFADASLEFKLAQSSALATGFGVSWFDYDNDGWLDLFAANGAVSLLPALRGQPFPFHQRNQLFHNERGKFFQEISSESISALQLSEVSRGAAFGDLDNDGDLDIVVSNNNGIARLMLNESKSSHHWAMFRLEGVQANRSAIGAIVRVQLKNKQQFQRRVHSDGSYLSANDLRVHFGLGTNPEIEAVIVEWPNRSKEKFSAIKTNTITPLKQGTGTAIK